MAELVPNEPFRKRFIRLQEVEDLSLAEVAVRIGWINPPNKKNPEGVADTTRVARLLGLKGQGKNGEARQRISHENAEKLCRALHLDPFEVGI